MWIKIKHGEIGWWYQSRVGEEFKAIRIDGKPDYREFYFLVIDQGKKKHVKINDAELVDCMSINIIDEPEEKWTEDKPLLH